MIFSVIIPSYKRTDDLRRCLAALREQQAEDFEALVVCRPDDEPTRHCITEFQTKDARFHEVLVHEPGLIAALNAGLAKASGKFVAFTDDDAKAPTQWLKVILNHFEAHPRCGAVGGPDRLVNIKSLRNPKAAKKVGVYSWTGKFYGNHHCPITDPFLKTEMLKGVNMTYRHELIRGLRIGDGLRGTGAQVGSEASLANRTLAKGYELHFVRENWIEHFASPRSQHDDRTDFTTQFALDSTYNQHFTLARYRGRIAWYIGLARAVVLGSRFIPGIIRSLAQGRYPSLLVQHFPQMLMGGKEGLRLRKVDGMPPKCG